MTSREEAVMNGFERLATGLIIQAARAVWDEDIKEGRPLRVSIIDVHDAEWALGIWTRGRRHTQVDDLDF